MPLGTTGWPIREGTSGPILDWITTRRVDVAILYNTMPTPQASTETICKETMYLVGLPSDPPLPELTKVADLEGVPLILPGSTEALRILCEMAAAQIGVHLKVVIEADTFTAIRRRGLRLQHPAVSGRAGGGQQGLYQVSRLEHPRVTRELVVMTCGDRVSAPGKATLVRLIKKTVLEAVDPYALAAVNPK